MPRQISEAMHAGKEWFMSPVRASYDFLFPPLDDLFMDDTITKSGKSWSGSRSGKNAASASNFDPDDSLDRLDVWDSFSDSPWSFVTSRYAIALIIVAIINNRVQHICRPRGGATARLSQVQRIALRLPSLVLLARTVLILVTVVADAFFLESNLINALLRSCTTISWRSAWLAYTPMSGWASDRFGTSSRDALLRARDASALWATFTSTCVAIISDTVVRNLDADREEPPAFNLVGFAFLLHFHSFSPEAPANEHVYLCVLLQMLQIFTIAVSRCFRPVLAPRLVISSVFGISSLLHYALAANSGRYPFLEALSRTPEIALVLVVLLTVTLHGLTMLLLEGTIQPHRLLFARSNLPTLDEDWSLALFKLGTACMESTRLTGLEREVDPLVAWDAPYIELSSSGRIELVDPLASRASAAHLPSDFAQGGNSIESGGLSREVKQVRIEPAVRSGASWTFGHAGLSRFRAALQFVTATLLVARSVAVMGARKVLAACGVADPRVPRWVYRALRLARLVWHGRNGEARRRERQAADAQRRRQQQRQREQRRLEQEQERFAALASASAHAGDESRSGRSLLELSRSQINQDGAAELVEGRQVTHEGADRDSDEDDQDYDETILGQEADYDSDDVSADHDEAEELELEADEVSGLLEEFTCTDSTGSTSAQRTLHMGSEAFNQLLLAHLTRSISQPPLTRSEYSALVHRWPPAMQADADLARSMVDRRANTSGGGAGVDEARRVCVVCCTSERNVVCWPCRCLCLCMECREHLASRPPARRAGGGDPTHLCPTCRTPVQAFSRLYIP